MALDAAMFNLYVFLFIMFSVLLFLIVICCKFAIFEDDQKTENRRRNRDEESGPNETSRILSTANLITSGLKLSPTNLYIKTKSYFVFRMKLFCS